MHLFDSPLELNPADEAAHQVTDFFDVELEDNYTFDSESVKYRLMTPNIPARVLSLNMGTRVPSQLFMDHYQNHGRPETV